jgi:hypothetical protein
MQEFDDYFFPSLHAAFFFVAKIGQNAKKKKKKRGGKNPVF